MQGKLKGEAKKDREEKGKTVWNSTLTASSIHWFSYCKFFTDLIVVVFEKKTTNCGDFLKVKENNKTHTI